MGEFYQKEFYLNFQGDVSLENLAYVLMQELVFLQKPNNIFQLSLKNYSVVPIIADRGANNGGCRAILEIGEPGYHPYSLYMPGKIFDVSTGCPSDILYPNIPHHTSNWFVINPVWKYERLLVKAVKEVQSMAIDIIYSIPLQKATASFQSR